MNGHAKKSSKEMDKTNPFGQEAYRPRRWKIWIWSTLSILILAALAFIIVPRIPPAKKPPQTRLDLQLRINEILALESVVREEKQKSLNIFTEFVTKAGIDSSTWDPFHPTQEQLNQLQYESRESGIGLDGYRGGLKKITELKKRIELLEKQLGTPRIVTQGETHSSIVLEFLLNKKGFSQTEAEQITQGLSLTEPLLPGFKIWNFQLPDGFCTFVTQGEAPITPSEAISQSEQRQREEKERALNRLNTLFFIIGSSDYLESRGILSGGILKNPSLGEVNPQSFRQSIDLREQKRIPIQAKSLKLEQIQGVRVFPNDLREGRDYSIRIGRQKKTAQFIILKPDIFRNRRIVIAVE